MEGAFLGQRQSFAASVATRWVMAAELGGAGVVFVNTPPAVILVMMWLLVYMSCDQNRSRLEGEIKTTQQPEGDMQIAI